ncbi:hypothetical protein HPB50_009174 [Hyalomma asiaticum]|uniref:Uncharacterized protein n=1 Tax=Hyalomma asiaticum TaxID=266040 RepID=A0ACB7STB3_HYAAI|nr:hypothetical protein HPB50_009174 [Hyalomma asiaticum]
MSEKSREVVYIPTCYPEEGLRTYARPTRNWQRLAPRPPTSGSSTSSRELIEEHRIQQQREDAAAVPAAAADDEDADLLPNEELMRAVKDTSPCAAVRKRQDVMDRDEYAKLMRMTNAENQSDASFLALLTKIGDGRALQDDEVRLLENCFITTEDALVRASSAIRIFYSNEDVNKFNTFIAQQGGEVSLQAEDTYLPWVRQPRRSKQGNRKR